MHTLTLHRRHRPACKAKHPVDSYSTEAEERRQNWKKCRCKIYAHGTLNGIFRKLATRARDWERAKEVVAPYLAAGRWDITPPEPPPPVLSTPPGDAPPAEAKSGVPVTDAIQAFLKDLKASQSAVNTIRKYRVVMSQFERFSTQVGLRYLEEWKRATVRLLLESWAERGNGQLTRQKKLGVLKTFFEPYFEDEILDYNPARIKTRRNRAFYIREGSNSKQRNPFTDEELTRMLEACRSFGSTELRRWPKHRDGRRVIAITEYRDYRRKWTGEDLADFIQISYFTGLRISDVATFDISRLTPSGEVNVRATKNGNWVSVRVPEWLRDRIRARAARIGPRIFGTRASTNINVITNTWRDRLNALWAASGPWKEKPTHHRFRHTFVRILLERDVPLALVAELAGDTEQIIRRHYSAWMPKRQESTSRILAEAFRDVPRFHG